MSRFLSALVLLAVPGFAQDAATQARTEIQRIQDQLKAKPAAGPDAAGLVSTINATLKASGDALQAGRLFLGLESLSQALQVANGAFTAEEKADVVKSSLAAFQVEWNKVSVSLAALERDVRAKDWTRSPAVIRALSETALGKTSPLMSGSQGFATSTQPTDGLYYMGQALGNAEFARLGGALNLSRKGRAFPLRSMLSELLALQEKTNGIFKPPRSIEQHPRFIALNGTIKLARELDAAKFYAGSLYQYLESLRRFAMFDTPEPQGEQRIALKQSIAAWLVKHDASKDDDSIARLFVERAESYTTHADGSQPSKDEWTAAQVIVDQVLPAYFAARKPPLRTQRSSGKTIAITLVRWPYT